MFTLLRDWQAGTWQRCIWLLVATWAFSWMPGCASRNHPGLTADHVQHDFGILHVDNSSKTVQHTFRLTNTSANPVTIVAVNSSCQCVIASDIRSGRTIESGATIDLPVSVSLDGKAGHFAELIIVRTFPESTPPCLLTLKGFVKRPPIRSAERVVFRAAKSHVATKELVVTHLQLAEEPKTELASYHIEGNAHFAVEKVQVASKQTRLGKADVWTFVLRYCREEEVGEESAVLILHWKTPQSVDRVPLVGTLLPVVEIIEERFVMADTLAAGQMHSYDVPISIHDFPETESVEVVSEPPVLRGTIDVTGKRLRFSVRPDRVGRFSSRIAIFQNGHVVDALDVVGVAE